jgi:pimeloyl-ACP methyl ester carboxylesterase
MKRSQRWWLIAALVLVLTGVRFYLWPVSCFLHCIYLRGWLEGVESRVVLVDGYRIHYDVLGPKSGPAVVLVHGLGGRAEDWQKLSPYLAKAGYRVYMPDLPGFGRSDWPAEFSYSVRDQAGFVVEFLNVLGLQQVDLGGWSMGGWIAQIVALEHPERVRRLMLFDSAGLAEAPAWDTRLFTPTTPAELDQLDALLFPHPPYVPGFVARDILRISEQRAWVIHRTVATMMTGHDATESELPNLKMPVLIVWGTEDRLLPLSEGEKMQRLIPHSKLEAIEGCGHMAPVQCAGQIGPVVVEFERQ